MNDRLRRISPLWSVTDVSEYLQVPVQTLYSWRSTGGGPPARKVGKYLRYVPEDVVAWVDGLGTEVA
ncbi:helix-turn-helix domain-containing protein [Kineosporia sp. J2-2]|uniref:Helix-turn-helix domain-containing protein n=1 Tax=Kineosporia corallincola TaxID=2835133 RepID=A0ABS5TPY0_9ACTN|nr:helix-turn-helix domain-containing protein [Kineosporia corallincola]MBT0773162.1 helix-turn-helix domain-containing protein [Kineosporia corallincola]